jgi:hypothetical protein
MRLFYRISHGNDPPTSDAIESVAAIHSHKDHGSAPAHPLVLIPESIQKSRNASAIEDLSQNFRSRAAHRIVPVT